MPSTVPGSQGETGLKAGAIGFFDALVIGLASVSPAYSLAAVIGAVVALTGVYSPGVFLASFLPMLLVASAFYYLNSVDQDCGTTFSWVTRAMGPWFGWLGGYAIAMTGVLVVGSLSEVGVRFSLLTVGAEGLADNIWVVRALAVVLILVMAWICVLGIELSARVQNVLILGQVAALIVFAVVALVKVAAGESSLDSITPSVAWLNPFGHGGAALSGGLLLGVFVYWGWETAVNLTEETENPAHAPGLAGVLATVILVGTYVAVAFAVVAYAGTGFLAQNSDEEEFLFALLSTEVLGRWDWILLFAVATSAIASTQTTIMPASRTWLSMARRHAVAARFAHVHGTNQTPDVSTWWVAGIAIAWYLLVSVISENALFDSLTALSLLIAFYYGLTGLACALYFRRRLLASVKNFLLIGLGPVVGAVMLFWLLVRSAIDMSDPANSYSGQAWFGLGPPLVIGIAIAAVGVVWMFVWRAVDARYWDETPTALESQSP